MNTYLLKIGKEDRDPTGKGDPRSWFLYYKWSESEGEEFLAVPMDQQELYEGIQEGDPVWVSLEDSSAGDFAILGHITVLRTVEDDFNGVLEIWFDQRNRVPHSGGLRHSAELPNGKLHVHGDLPAFST